MCQGPAAQNTTFSIFPVLTWKSLPQNVFLAGVKAVSLAKYISISSQKQRSALHNHSQFVVLGEKNEDNFQH